MLGMAPDPQPYSIINIYIIYIIVIIVITTYPKEDQSYSWKTLCSALKSLV